MPITLSVTHETAGGVIAEVKELLGLNGLPPMQEQPNRDVIVTNTPRPGDKPGSRTRS